MTAACFRIASIYQRMSWSSCVTWWVLVLVYQYHDHVAVGVWPATGGVQHPACLHPCHCLWGHPWTVLWSGGALQVWRSSTGYKLHLHGGFCGQGVLQPGDSYKVTKNLPQSVGEGKVHCVLYSYPGWWCWRPGGLTVLLCWEVTMSQGRSRRYCILSHYRK